MIVLNKHEKKRVLAMALFAGELMLKSGAETYRTEDTIIRMCQSRGMSSVSAFVTPTVIMVGDDRADGYSFVKSIDHRTTNLEIVSLVNELSRRFVNFELTVEQAYRELKEISVTKSYNKIFKLVCCGIASSMFGYLFGGNFSDMVSGFIIAIIATEIGTWLEGLDVNLFLSNAICSIVIAILAIALMHRGIGDNLDMVIAGAIMPQLPGFSLTNGIRDFIAGDLLSGLSRAFEAVMIATAIAVSIGSVLSLYYTMGGVI